MRSCELFKSHIHNSELIIQTAMHYFRSPMMMNAMTSPYNAMASTSAKPIHMYFPTRPSASGCRATASIIFPKIIRSPRRLRQTRPRPIPFRLMLLLLNPLYVFPPLDERHSSSARGHCDREVSGISEIHAGQDRKNIGLNKRNNNFQSIHGDREGKWQPADIVRRDHHAEKDAKNHVARSHVGK